MSADAPPAAAKVVAVVSNKGGVGKTTVATNLAIYLRALHEELPVALVTLDDQSIVERMFRLKPAGLGAGNLKTFMQLADGIDDETWLFHLRRGDYGEWFLNKVQDEELAAVADQLKSADDVSAEQSRARIHEMIQKLYVKHV